jgi:hypothetical protein
MYMGFIAKHWLTGDPQRNRDHSPVEVEVSDSRRLGAPSKDNSDDWGRMKRICTSDYFRRYFNYGIPPDDISDREIEEFISSLGETDVRPVISRLETLCSRNRAGILIQKLRMYEDKIAPRDAGILALAISMRSDLIPESLPDDKFFGLGALPQAAFLLRELIDREIPTARDELAKSIANKIERLPFAYEFRDKIRKFRKERGSEEFVAVVSDDCDFAVNAAGLLAEHTVAEERGCVYAAHFALTYAC